MSQSFIKKIENEYRCHCNKLLCKGQIVQGKIEIKCPRCGYIKKISDTPEYKPIDFIGSQYSANV